MSNSDYLIKATIKKVSEKLNEIFSSKLDEAANAAQEAPEVLKKEIEILKDEIIKEAKKMEEDGNNESIKNEITTENHNFIKASKKISLLTQKLNEINTILDN